MKISVILSCILILLISSCAHVKEPYPPLQVVPYVDLDRYIGTWYEIARYPHRFQKGCIGSKATYTLREDGRISVLNECYKDTDKTKLRSAKGKAWVVDANTNARLKVSFFWPFSGDYWIIDLGKNYEYAVVGHPTRKYLWILNRDPEMNEEVYEGILKRLSQQHYDTSKLIRSQH